MTEQEWLDGDDPQKMLVFLLDSGEATDRRLRLFGCACSRQVWGLLTEGCFRDAVEVAERFADGQATRKELAFAKKVSGSALERNGLAGVTGKRYCALGTAWSTARNPETAAMYPLWVFTDEAERKWELSLLRDIFGNPFRAAPAIEQAALGWNGRTIPKLTLAAYEERHLPSGNLDPHRLAVLADALEEAGCTRADVLDHLRGPGPHVRGCWAVDCLLWKGDE